MNVCRGRATSGRFKAAFLVLCALHCFTFVHSASVIRSNDLHHKLPEKGSSCALKSKTKIVPNVQKQQDTVLSTFRNAPFKNRDDAGNNYTFTGVQGIVTSPGYPANYPDNINVTYSITVPAGYFVYMIMYSFRTEACCDMLDVYDGGDPNNDNKIVSLSGEQTGTILKSSGAKMSMVFHTDLVTNDIGFYGEFIAVLDGTSYTQMPTCDASNYDMTNMRFKFGEISSPLWPALYPNNISCKYLLTADYGKKPQITFFAFNTEQCCDFVYIYDGADDSANQIAKLSGAFENLTTTQFTATSNQMFVVFTSDITENRPGFSALYEEV